MSDQSTDETLDDKAGENGKRQEKPSLDYNCEYCDQPDSEDDMVQCEFCAKWAHNKCADIKSGDSILNRTWKCKFCSKQQKLLTAEFNLKVDQIDEKFNQQMKELKGMLQTLMQLQQSNATTTVNSQANAPPQMPRPISLTSPVTIQPQMDAKPVENKAQLNSTTVSGAPIPPFTPRGGDAINKAQLQSGFEEDGAQSLQLQLDNMARDIPELKPISTLTGKVQPGSQGTSSQGLNSNNQYIWPTLQTINPSTVVTQSHLTQATTRPTQTNNTTTTNTNNGNRISSAEAHAPPLHDTSMLDFARTTAEGIQGLTKLVAQSYVGDLPEFDGTPKLWPKFRDRFWKTREKFSESANLDRLEKALKGDANKAVAELLFDPAHVDAIMVELESTFGQPERVINDLMQDLRKVKPPNQGPPKLIVPFSHKLNVLVANIKAINREEYLHNPMEVQYLVSRLHTNMQLRWTEFRLHHESAATLSDLNDWVKIQASLIAKLPSFGRPEPSSKEHTHLHYEEDSSSETTAPAKEPKEGEKRKCGCCKRENHKTSDCRQFIKMNVKQRWNKVKDNRLCLSCLNSRRHAVKDCPEAKLCGINGCTYKHHKLLHSDKKETDKNTQKKSETENVGLNMANSKQTWFKVLPITLMGNGKQLDTFALLDDGSSATLLDQSVANFLNLKGDTDPLCIRWTKGIHETDKGSMRTSLKIAGKGSGQIYKLKNVRTINNLNLQNCTQNAQFLKENYSHLADLPIHDLKSVKPQILIGLEHNTLLIPEEVRAGKPREPVALLTKLGWAIQGKVVQAESSEDVYTVTICECQQSEESVDQLTRQYFAMENLGVTPTVGDPDSIENERAKTIIQKTMKKVGDHYEIGLFWKSDDSRLSNSYPMALKRLQGIEHKMKKDADFAQWYNKTITESLEKGYLRKATPTDLASTSDRIWYLPHFCVSNHNKQPPKRRLVYDAAARMGQISLNGALIKGPDGMASLLGVLFKFRQFRVAVVADVKEMFSQVKIRAEDQQSQRVLWRFGNQRQEPQIFIHDSMMFGSICSPSSAQAIKNHNAELHKEEFRQASNAIINKMYVDDYLDSFGSMEEAVAITNQVIAINKSAGFMLRNFASNANELLQQLPPELVKEQPVEHNMDNSLALTEKVLGLQWNISTDEFGFKLDEKIFQESSQIPTKRQVWRAAMKVYDPLGFISHVTIHARVLMQNIWKTGIGWDEPLNEPLFESWKIWLLNIRQTALMKIPRCYFNNYSDGLEIELHVFVDASLISYAAVAYFRYVFEHKTLNVAFVGSKARVAPTRNVTIPRLELMAALLGSRLSQSIQNEHTLNISRKYMWSDSKVVLGWIRSTTKKFKQFVAARKGEINELTSINEWRYVPTKLNVADIATKWRGNDEVTQDLWFHGPEFLAKHQSMWPQESPAETSNDAAIEEINLHQIATEIPMSFSAINPERFSNWRRLVRAVCYVHRFIDTQIKKSQTFPQYLTVSELKRAENLLVRKAQHESFQEECQMLEHGGEIEPKSSIYTLSPVMADDGVVRMQSRLQNAMSAFETKNPAILPKDHHLTMLIVKHYHEKYLHHGQECVLNALRQRFWIPSARTVVKRVKKRCQHCKNKAAQPQLPIMGQLPSARVLRSCKPFMGSGVDLFGPIQITVNRHHEKRWGVLFVCMATRAIHIELANNLSSDAFIVCLRNFVFRRGPCTDLYSDNGTNIVGAYRELKNEWIRLFPEIAERSAEMEISWHPNPPSAPHFGGAWESLIKIVKKCLEESLNEIFPREDTLRSALIEAEFIVNSRPLTHVSMDNEDDDPLTPNHFLLGCAGNAPAVMRCDEDGRVDRRQWKIASHITNCFWKKWIKNYLPELARRTKWHERVESVKVGDIGLVVDDNATRNSWRKVKVIEVHPGKDKVVRAVTLKTATGELKRPVAKFVKLDVRSN
jgi:hypothetical protein